MKLKVDVWLSRLRRRRGGSRSVRRRRRRRCRGVEGAQLDRGETQLLGVAGVVRVAVVPVGIFRVKSDHFNQIIDSESDYCQSY